MQRLKVLIVNGHPRKGSFSEALAEAYVAGALEANTSARKLTLYELSFDPNVTGLSPKDQLTEPDIAGAITLIDWADHIVFIYPTWWGTMPALLKGFIDRVFTAGFAFMEIEGGTGYAPLLRGKSAQLITTMDTPYLVFQLIYRAPGVNAMRRATLEFCGMECARTMTLGPMNKSTDVQREKWIAKIKAEGRKLKRGALSPAKRFRILTINWLKALRLQFYPMTFIAYAVGAFAAKKIGHEFVLTSFFLGYLWLFFLEAATVLLNEYFDYSADKKNHYFGPFTGGSRVLVDKLLSFTQIRTGIGISLSLAIVTLTILIFNLEAVRSSFFASMLLTVLALGYTVPPLKLSYHGFGELTVGITHSFAVIICGYLFMGGSISDTFPWIIGLPLFLAVLPSIILAGIPDYDADKQAGKNTLAVKLGRRSAARLALLFTWMASGMLIMFNVLDMFNETFSGAYYFAIPNAILLSFFITRYITQSASAKRIDSLIVISLFYLIWFALIPLINLS